MNFMIGENKEFVPFNREFMAVQAVKGSRISDSLQR